MRVLLVNDDGPPSTVSPHVYGLWETLQSQLGWQVSVVLPSSQKSWGSMQFSMTPVGIWYYYPIHGNFNGTMESTNDSWSSIRRPIRDNEVGEWMLLDASPAACANVGLFSFDSLVPSTTKPAPFDLVISGPNFGRNVGAAFSMASATVGAAMSAALSGTKAIALSYGHFQVLTEEMKAAEVRYKMQGLKTGSDNSVPVKDEVVEIAHRLSCRIMSKLYDEWEECVSVYSINVPLSYILKEEMIYWTQAWASKYGQLFKMNDVDPDKEQKVAPLPRSAPRPKQEFRFAPNMAGMLQPKQPVENTDVWALTKGYVSISRLEARYADASTSQSIQGRFKL